MIGVFNSDVSRRRNAYSEVNGANQTFGDVAGANLEDSGRRPRRDLVHSIFAVYDHRMSCAQFHQRLRHRGRQPHLGNPDQLARRTRGIGNRTQQVEQGPDAEFLSERNHPRHRGMIIRGEHEADAGALQAALESRRVELDAHPESLQHVSGADDAAGGAIAALGDAYAGGGRD